MNKKNQIRLIMMIPAIILGCFIFSFLSGLWATYCLTEGSMQSKGEIISELSHGVFKYKYDVQGKQYIGQGQCSKKRYKTFHVGDETIINYSISHPSISSMKEPGFSFGAVFMLLIAIFAESLVLGTILNPNGAWSFKV